MVRDRMFGSDQEFMAWVRECGRRGELPSFSTTVGVGVSDVDCAIHRYIHSVDAMGTRELQSLMWIEAKSRGGNVPESQKDTLFKLHSTMVGECTVNGQLIKNWGVSFVFMSGITPDDSTSIEWGRFLTDGSIHRRRILRDTLVRVLKFDLHPNSLNTRPFRRHHKTEVIVEKKIAPLGFEYDEIIKRRS